MSDKDIHLNKYNELRSIYKYYIDSYKALYQLKTENEEEIHNIYKMIKTELIESMKDLPQNIIYTIFNFIPFNNRYIKSYLKLVKLISDNYHVTMVKGIPHFAHRLFYKEYGINLWQDDRFEKMEFINPNVLSEDTIYRAIMNNDKERFIYFTERDGFNEDQKLVSCLYPQTNKGFSLLELCCYHGAVDCFKLLRTIFESEITKTCLKLSFLGGNAEIINECLKYQKPNEKCMKYAIISHNIDFVTFLMNEYNLEIDLEACIECHNLESLLVYFDQANDVKRCFVYSAKLNISSLSKYFFSLGANINEKIEEGWTALHFAAFHNSKDTANFLILHGTNINEKNINGNTALHVAAFHNSKDTAKLLISHGVNINEKDKFGNTPLYTAAYYNSKDTVNLLISHGANIHEKDKFGSTPLYPACMYNSLETVKLLISHGANINEKNKYGVTSLHVAAQNNSKYAAEHLILYGANIHEKDISGETILHYAAINNSQEIAELLLSYGANVNEKDIYGISALHAATINNSQETAELLLSHGANVNETDNRGSTVPHYVSIYNSKETAELLLSHGANINKKLLWRNCSSLYST
ncbi:ankyrin repeat protein, putative [Trichomonas vaginalis G3]|uniref:Ankyrin repeat protein, putative n=1 Tax=Trichomonas vaginalis (strain ATCC PRA-98 / G3) TaxID=412133 RepID=A2EPQ4_TRIV3|nr:ankyrin repeat and SOCS box-containing protein 4 family [Trichomonas vaginalis G3]EAY05397.1 ankyrin repeat protein, putative [Trichomonas vaginalis G3]KAI5524086.1 ankyrin repeat and SOCS box-containing protein 4 family [Trichomonas vaginalis G3]|eukprot:XP_001317620.1 ankyrin repeat protein [Trichomonas vaginalis G3]